MCQVFLQGGLSNSGKAVPLRIELPEKPVVVLVGSLLSCTERGCEVHVASQSDLDVAPVGELRASVTCQCLEIVLID